MFKISEFFLFVVVLQAFNRGQPYCRLALPGMGFQCHWLSPPRSFCRVQVNTLVRTSEMFPRVASAAALISGGEWSAVVLAGLCGTQSGWVPDRAVALGSLCVLPWKQKRLLGRKIRLFSETRHKDGYGSGFLSLSLGRSSLWSLLLHLRRCRSQLLQCWCWFLAA